MATGTKKAHNQTPFTCHKLARTPLFSREKVVEKFPKLSPGDNSRAIKFFRLISRPLLYTLSGGSRAAHPSPGARAASPSLHVSHRLLGNNHFHPQGNSPIIRRIPRTPHRPPRLTGISYRKARRNGCHASTASRFPSLTFRSSLPGSHRFSPAVLSRAFS